MDNVVRRIGTRKSGGARIGRIIISLRALCHENPRIIVRNRTPSLNFPTAAILWLIKGQARALATHHDDVVSARAFHRQLLQANRVYIIPTTRPAILGDMETGTLNLCVTMNVYTWFWLWYHIYMKYC